MFCGTFLSDACRARYPKNREFPLTLLAQILLGRALDAGPSWFIIGPNLNDFPPHTLANLGEIFRNHIFEISEIDSIKEFL
jgi:hypothetical protein